MGQTGRKSQVSADLQVMQPERTLGTLARVALGRCCKANVRIWGPGAAGYLQQLSVRSTGCRRYDAWHIATYCFARDMGPEGDCFGLGVDRLVLADGPRVVSIMNALEMQFPENSTLVMKL